MRKDICSVFVLTLFASCLSIDPRIYSSSSNSIEQRSGDDRGYRYSSAGGHEYAESVGPNGARKGTYTYLDDNGMPVTVKYSTMGGKNGRKFSIHPVGGSNSGFRSGQSSSNHYSPYSPRNRQHNNNNRHPPQRQQQYTTKRPDHHSFNFHEDAPSFFNSHSDNSDRSFFPSFSPFQRQAEDKSIKPSFSFPNIFGNNRNTENNKAFGYF